RDSGRIWVCDVTGRKLLATLNATGTPSSLAVCSSRPLLATAAVSPRIEMWDLPAGKPVHLKRPDYAQNWSRAVRVAYSPDGKAVATVRRDGSMFLWDAVTRQPRFVLQRSWSHGWPE